MNRTLLNTAVAAVIGIMISGSVYAGNTPNSARTLTGGIGSGTTHGRVPSSHPGTKSRAASYRNNHAADYMSKYRSGLSHRPSSASSSSSSNRPTTVPGADRWNENAEANARSRIPASLPPTGGSNPGSGTSTSAGIPSSVSAGIPSSVSTGGAPASLPPALPSGATGGMGMAGEHMSAHVPSGVPDAAFSGLSKRPSGVGRP
jgi:hypothetical protein